MIIVDNYKFITPGKTGSVSVNRCLRLSLADREVHVIHEKKNNRSSHHQIVSSHSIVDESVDYEVVLLVRNSYDRWASAFFFTQFDILKDDLDQTKPLRYYQEAFLLYLKWQLRYHQNIKNIAMLDDPEKIDGLDFDFMLRSLVQYYQKTNPTHIIRLENLEEDLKKIGLPINEFVIPHVNKTINKPKNFSYKDLYNNPKILKAAHRLFKADLEFFGYPIIELEKN